jgi:transposase-like protein
MGEEGRDRHWSARRCHVAEKIKALERENRELKQANAILRKASAYFAQAELDRPFKK